MASFTFTSPAGKKYTVSGPDGATKEQAFAQLQKQMASRSAKESVTPSQQPDVTEGMSSTDLAIAGAGKSFVDTARGLGQIGRAVLPKSASDYLGLPTSQDAEDARQRDEALMNTGAGLAGNIGGQIGQMVAGGGLVGLAGKGVATFAPQAGRAMQYIGQGITAPKNATQAGAGAAAFAGTQPVTADGSRFTNVAAGGVAGAAGAAIAGKIASKLGERFGKIEQVRPLEAAQHADDVINQALAEVGQNASDIPAGYIDSLKNTVAQSLSEGKKLDPAAMMRKADFDALGIEGLRGQYTRNPMEFARERNLRGVEGVGEGITDRLVQQEKKLRAGAGKLAEGSTEHQMAGDQLSKSLMAIDETKRKAVSKAYTAARASGEAAEEVNLTGLAQDYARIAHEFGDKVPSGVRNVLDDFGLLKGKQMKLMTVDDAEKVLNVINNNVGMDKATNTALGQLRTAIKDAVTTSTGGGGAFEGARKMAAKRFALHDDIPALAKSAQGDANADTFVKNYLIGGQTKDVNALTALLQKENPKAFDLARAQVGDYLQTAAYGVNPAGDAPFHAAAFTKAIKTLGTDKLKAFYSPAEITEMKRLGRVAAYIHSHPNAAAVSTSNSGVPVTNALIGLLGSHIPGANLLGSAARTVKDAMQRESLAKNALSGQLPVEYATKGYSQNALNRARVIGGAGGYAGYESTR